MLSEHKPPSDDYVREHGVVVMISLDGTTGLVETHGPGLLVSFASWFLGPEGQLITPVPRPVNKFVRVKPCGES